ncbi:cytochrome c [Vibrio coralliilyticus OCN008]|uniref:c-type cytochrome n=1 Tax=Vibrio TaxID=662 RepID=UPI0003911CB2|nr:MULTISPECIES: c-type cytochrome [Vibrio]ERB65660.1 cytochrome C [Vibrio coralliilyticus OCN008]QIJ86595.1 cytochrome c [Vibrio coralliilyticus OCN008]
MRKSILALIFCSLPVFGAADDYQKLANMCIACHGSDNNTAFPSIPNLKWQNKLYLTKQLSDFKNSQRQDATMTKVAQLLSEEDIEKLADYFYTLNHQE